MRGEHAAPQSINGVDPGSSPHARGTQPLDVTGAEPPGIIPACAGNTNSMAC
ncbi:hypothetical protein BBOU_0613 [Bifidobacterium boum]|uniref:Uncharacterized protein n=1 Tax=Bifidobacterium boum TaxID=78343 RepID=A0A086ZPN4_9BIFI|nr:hypothetical protein BBOU_0613 [Bifidobacterium boum]